MSADEDGGVTLYYETLDPELRCVMTTTRVEAQSIEAVAKALDVDLAGYERSFALDLEAEDVAALRGVSTLGGVDQQAPARLRTPHRMDCLPYEIHTDRELRLMLNGAKPMAMFSRGPGERFADICGQPFHQFVAVGALLHGRFHLLARQLNNTFATYDIFSLPGEQWRSEAMRMLVEDMHAGAWTLGHELLEGALLGYSAEQNRIYRDALLDPTSPLFRPAYAGDRR